MAMKALCPACGAEVRFQASSTVFAVCEFCSSMLVRHDLNLEAIGKMATLPEDISPLQIGVQGDFQGRKFELIGRLRMEWEAGGWNEWYMLFGDGREGWLAEAQGFLMVSFPVSLAAKDLPEAKSLHVGQQREIGGVGWTVDEMRPATCVGSEGELPFRAPHGRKSLTVDLSDGKDGFATLDFSDEGPRFYRGLYLELDTLKPKGLRSIEGW